jgi:voltage-gated potassium channel
MAEPPSSSLKIDRWIDRRLGSKALRPRYAARVVAVTWLAAVLLFGVLERIVDPDTFDTVWLAFWWALQTVTTVGYGDVVPQDTAGKAIGAVLMLGGLSFLSIITAIITSAFVARRQADLQARGDDPVIRRLDEIAARLDVMEAAVHERGRDARPPGSSS